MIQCPGQMILCFNVASLLQNIYNNQGQNGIFFSFVYLNGTDDLIQTESQIFVPVCYFLHAAYYFILRIRIRMKNPKETLSIHLTGGENTPICVVNLTKKGL